MNTWRKILLLIMSILAYIYFVEWFTLCLVVLSGGIILSVRLKEHKKSKVILIAPIILLIIGFLIFKIYSTSNTMPIGYSVFAFSGIALLVDCYRSPQTYPVLNSILYLWFFPKMLAGPIIRIDDFSKQLDKTFHIKINTFYEIFKIIVFSSFCKFIIADNISLFLEKEQNGVNGVLGIILFACQLYVDFFAYSNFAIAFGMLCGINLPINFLAPYKSKTFSEFWRRWNITLSAWLKDYVYIPLGGNRKGKNRKILNIYLTFIVSALWHGLSLPFFIWGLAHASLVAVESNLRMGCCAQWKQYIYQIFVICMVAILWQLFRLGNLNEIVFLVKHLADFHVPLDLQLIAVTFVVGMCVVLIDSKWVNYVIFSSPSDLKHIYGEVSLLCVMLMALFLCKYQASFNFFYFRF